MNLVLVAPIDARKSVMSGVPADISSQSFKTIIEFVHGEIIHTSYHPFLGVSVLLCNVAFSCSPFIPHHDLQSRVNDTTLTQDIIFSWYLIFLLLVILGDTTALEVGPLRSRLLDLRTACTG